MLVAAQRQDVEVNGELFVRDADRDGGAEADAGDMVAIGNFDCQTCQMVRSGQPTGVLIPVV
jgi:hypothetical protein